MTSFHTFLREQRERGGFTTEDVLVAFLPLMSQVIATHEAEKAAPLEGLAHLHVEGTEIAYSNDRQQPQKRNFRRVRKMLFEHSSGVDVIGERRVTFDVDEGIEQDKDLQTAGASDDLQRPAYIPGYVCWEHRIDHHDPATDVFSLGLILASLACSLDLTEADDHSQFVTHRRNLFRINPALHPVLARAIFLMTELDRHQRPQNLPALLSTLENYRDHDVDFETDLASEQTLPGGDRPGRRQAVLTKLQERLFEINRRNRLLQFRSTMQTVNLTHASIPLSFDVSHIREDQILTWSGSFADAVTRQKPVSLNRFLNFREAVYLPGQLDRIKAEARRDETEYGFAQLRLIIGFLRWADLKASPPERYESPLLLVPVKLDVKKGIHDRYSLTAIDGAAEVNPVIRHLFRQLYDIELPETVDLRKDGVDAFYSEFRQLIRAGDGSVELSCIQKPRIELIHEKARRRLDQFRRRARLSGRGIRHFMDLDYNYDPINYHPLGVRIFEQFITPAKTHLEGVVSPSLPKQRYMVAENTADANAVEAEQSFYSLKNESDDNPFNWEFDLCSVTLANLKYRRMSLVRDYSRLVTDNSENAAFEATFSITPVDHPAKPQEALPVEDRFHVLPCDPTQNKAIAHARTGHSYIIQGPPGTGKSQTITNLISDYVMRGQRVLFVCEKRAAIDVVYHRLKQQGLHELCCLIHDSQADRKQFVMDLKATYEAFLAEANRPHDEMRAQRSEILTRLAEALTPVQHFSTAMTESPPVAGVPLRSMLDRLIELSDHVPTLVPREWERVPHFSEFVSGRPKLREFAGRLDNLRADGIFANHQLCLLSSDVADADRPVELVTEGLDWCLKGAAQHDAHGRLQKLIHDVDRIDLPSETTSSLQQLLATVDYAQKAEFLAESDLLELLAPDSPGAKTFAKRLKKLERCNKALSKAQKQTTHWKKKLSSEDTAAALQQARQLEATALRYLKPAYWRLRRVLNDAYDFSQHAVKPFWSHILAHLDHEHEVLADRYDVAEDIRNEFDIHVEFDRFQHDLADFQEYVQTQPGPIQSLHRHLLAVADGNTRLLNLTALKPGLDELCRMLSRFLDGFRHHSLDELMTALTAVQSSIGELPDFLYCLSSLKSLSPQLTSAIRTLPLTLTELEAAAAHRSLKAVYRENRDLAGYDHERRTTQLNAISEACAQLMRANAETVREFVRQRFAEHVRISSLPAARLTQEQKEFKKLYSRGRREVEHEFGKSMRYKSIRKLAADESGLVIRDLKPVWLMSPLSVSDTLPLSSDDFDVVVFDEASQITLEEAVPSLFRAEQTIVVGDEMQLPPTSFFSGRRADEDDELSFEEDGETIQYDLNSSSFLNHSARNLPTRMLGWHYRSRSESLISFSNHAFYSGRLLTVPEENPASRERQELIAERAQDGTAFADELILRPVSFHFCSHGIYEKRRNTVEADYIAALVHRLLSSKAGYSIGIVAFSEAQQNEIEQALKRLANNDPDFADLLEAETEREEDGQFVGLLIKNLENIQGDERDIIIMSVCYGPDPEGRIRMNFGPINTSGGEKRLNVAFSRARHFMALVASMRSSAITNDYNDGANCLKNYLKYAEACSAGHAGSVSAVLQGLSGRSVGELDDAETTDTLTAEIETALRSEGFQVCRNVGQSHFRCDLAVGRSEDAPYQLGILTDGKTWYAQDDLLERELMKPQLLREFGWNIEVVLARDWYQDRQKVLHRLLKVINSHPAENSESDDN